jgi:hypothetical protein
MGRRAQVSKQQCKVGKKKSKRRRKRWRMKSKRERERKREREENDATEQAWKDIWKMALTLGFSTKGIKAHC